MKKVFKKFNRTLSIMLAAAMVLTMVPQTAMPVLAAEVVADEPAASSVSEEETATPAETVVGETENTEISDESEPTEEQIETTEENNGTPVIEEEEQLPVEETGELPVEETKEPEQTELEEDSDPLPAVTAVTDYTASITADSGAATAFTGGVNENDSNKLTGDAVTFTVTPNSGYKIDSVTWKVGDSGTSTPLSDPTEAGGVYTYTIAADALADIADNITITVTTVQTFDVTVTVDAVANITTLASVIGGQETAINPVAESNTVNVETGTALSLKVVPAAGFTATVKVDGSDGAVTPDANNVYSIGEISAATTVAITTAAIPTSYTVTEAGDTAGDTAKATIEYKDNCVTTDGNTKTIAKDTDLKFSVSEKTPDAFKDKVVEVSYKIGSGEAVTLTEDATKDPAGTVYTVEKAKITGDITITVTVRELATSTVDISGIQAAQAAATYAIGDATDFAELTGSVPVTEGQTFRFKVTPVDPYKIDKVSVKHGAKEAVELKEDETSKEYSFVVTKDAPAIIVDASYDKTKVNSIEFKAADGSDAKSYKTTAITDGEGGTIADLNTPAAGFFTSGDTLLTTTKTVKVTLGSDDYDITKVELGDEVLYDASKPDGEQGTNPSQAYTIAFGDTPAAKVLTVTTKAKAFEEDVKVTFEKGEKYTVVDYTVATGATVEKDTTDKENDTYTIKAGEGYLKFDVTTVGKYTPAVTVNDDVEPLENPEAKDGKYSYTYLVSKLNSDGSGNTITIDAKIARKTVTLVYDEAMVDVSATVGNTAQTPAGKVYTVDDGETLTFKVAAKDNYKLDKVTKKGAADAEATDVDVTNGKFDLTVEENTTITITAEGVRAQKALRDKVTSTVVPTDKKGAYLVSNTGTYVGGAVEGGADVRIDDVKLLDSAKKEIPATDGEGDTTVKNWSASADKTEITLFPTTVIAGKTLTLQMIHNETKPGAEGEDPVVEAQTVAEYKLSVSAVLNPTGVKINDIKQATDTEGTYPITVNAGAEVSKIRLDMAETDADIVDKANTGIVDGKLKVTTGFKAGETKIKLYTLTDEAVADTDANRTLLKEVKVTTTALIDKDATKAPTVKAVNSTDVSITLSLDAKKLKIAEPVKGAVYYEIVATANGDVPKNGETKLLKEKVVKCVEKTADLQNTTLWFNAAGDADRSAYGTGGYCKYDVTVRLVHLKTDTDQSARTTEFAAADMVSETSYSASFTTGTKPFETKEPYYEDNLKLKKGASTIYTGQTAVIATPQFGKNTSYMVVDEEYCGDTTKGLEDPSKLVVEVDPETDAVSVTADENTALGKHTIEVVAISTDKADAGDEVPSMYASRATVTVTVVRGIESLEVSVPSDKFFKDPSPKKAANMTASVVYNNGSTDKNQVPKAKKVQWVLVNKDKKVLSAADYLNGKLTVAKNGKVTLAKDYTVSRTAKDNQFMIAAIADDFKDDVDLTPGVVLSGRTGRVAFSRLITITNDAMVIDRLAILDGKNKVIAEDGGSLEATDADGATLVAFIPGAPVKKVYTKIDLETYAADADNVKFTSGNKAISIGDDGTLRVNKPAKNVTLTAAPGDGNTDAKAKKSMKLTVDYDTTGELGLEIVKLTEDGRSVEYMVAEPDNQAPVFTDSTVAQFDLTVKQKDSAGAWVDVTKSENFTNYKIAVKSGKLLYNSGNGTARITTASPVTTITLTNNNVKPAVKKDYVLTNKGISELAKGTKAPKVTVKGSLKAGEYDHSQYVTVQLANTAKEGQTGYIEDFSKLYVKTDFDWTSYNVKKPDAQNEFVKEMNPKGYTRVNADGTFYLDFYNGPSYDAGSTNLTAGSYKVKVNFGEIDEDGCFKSVAPAAAVTLKVAKPKALSFKPATSYTISATDSSYVKLTGTGNYDSVVFKNLQNANIRGKENKFSTYFAIDTFEDERGNDVYVLKLTEQYYADVNNEQIKLDLSDKKNKDDLIGYVTYTAYQDGEQLTNTAKITMKVSAPAAAITKYSVSSGVIATPANSKVRVYVTDNKKNPVALAGVNYTDSKTSPKWECAFGGNMIEFTAKKASDDKEKLEIPITILPKSSYYVTEFEKLTDVTKKTEFVNKYGVKLTVKVTANDLANVNKGRIKVDTKQLSQTFTASMYDGANGNYVAYVPFEEVYTGTTFNHITNNSVKVGEGDSAPQLITVNRSGNSNWFEISMNKGRLEQAIKADVNASGKAKNTFYDAKGKAKTLTVKADVCYDAEGTQKDSFTFKLTMPATRSAYTDQGADGLTAYEQAVDALNKNKNAVAAKVNVHYNYDNNAWDTTAAQWDLLDAIIEEVGADSGIDFRVCGDDNTDAIGNGAQGISTILKPGSVVEPTDTTVGTLPITAKLKSSAAPVTTSVIEFTLTIPKTETDVTQSSAVYSEVSNFISNNVTKYAVNTVTAAQIQTDLRAYMKAWGPKQSPVVDLTNIRFGVGIEVEEAGFDSNGAPKAGSVTGEVDIWNIHNGNSNSSTVTINYTIAAPAAKDAVIGNVKTALGIDPSDTGKIVELAIANDKDVVNTDVLAVAQKAAGEPYTVEYKKKDDGTDTFDFNPVGAEAGSIVFTLVVKDGDGLYIGQSKDADGKVTGDATEITLNDTTTLTANANVMTVAQAKTAVDAWITKVNGADATEEDRAFLENVTNGATMETAVKTAIKCQDTDLTVTVEGFNKTPAAVDKDGSVTGTIVLSKGGTTNKKEEKISYTFTLAKTGAWTLDEAGTRVTNAVQAADIYISNTNVKTEAGKAAVAAQILAAAKAAVPAEQYDVAIKQEGDPKADVKLTVSNAAPGTPGKVTLPLVITDKNAAEGAAESAKTKEVTIELAIPALPEGSEGPTEPEEVTITTTLTDTIKTAVAEIFTRDTDPVVIKKTDSETTEWATISNDVLTAANAASGVSPDFEVVDAGTDQLTFSPDTTPTATIKVKVQQQNLTTNNAEITIEGITVKTTDDAPAG